MEEQEEKRDSSKVSGDKLSGDIRVGNVSGTGIAIGHKAQANVNYGPGASELAQAFAAVYERIDARPPDPDVEKEEIQQQVQKIEKEVVEAEAPNPNKVERWLKTLAAMAPDIFDVTVAALTSPAASVAMVIRKVVQKAKEEVEAERSAR